VDLVSIRAFREVAVQGSITAAARSLGYTQSAVSRQIAALELAIGARLLDRHARGVELTEHGRCLFAHADAVLHRIEAAERELQALDRLETGRLRVGAFPTANAVLIPLAMADFTAMHPNVSLSFIEGTTRRQLANLEAADVDLAIISAFPDQPLDSDRFELVHLLDDTLLIALPPSHPLAGRDRVRLAEIAGESWIAGDPGGDDRTLSPLRLQPAPATRIDFVVGEWTAKLGLVAAGLGITLVPSIASTTTRADVTLVPIHPDDAAPRGVYAATAKGRTHPPAVTTFTDLLADHAQALARRHSHPRQRRDPTVQVGDRHTEPGRF
jgi:DNA-binding transcriptional LysR family regulator